VHYVTPTEDNTDVASEVGDIIVATVDPAYIATMVDPKREALTAFLAS
jgi:hypothetical protein